MARFASKKRVDPTDAEEFTRPVRLQRRDPRAPPAGGGGLKEDEKDVDAKDDLLDDKERERLELARQEKDAQRQADLEQIAPRLNQPAGTSRKTGGFNNKKTTQVYDHDQTPEAKKKSQVRYEEALPWHLEDFDNRNTWVGAYESALSDMYVGLVRAGSTFRMVPMERWYKFTPKSHFKTLSIEEAEVKMSKAVKEPRWMVDRAQQQAQRRQQDADNRAGGRRLYLGRTGPGRGGDDDADMLDFAEDVQDDEGPQIMEGEEEEGKAAEERIRRDQLQANIFDLKDEKEYEQAEAQERKQAELAKTLGKGVKKALIGREKNYIYDSDSDADSEDEVWSLASRA